MIYEIGAGGIIAIPPRKYEYHRVARWGPHGVEVGETVLDKNMQPVPWCSTEHERYTRDEYNYIFGFRTTIRHRKGDLKLNYANRAIPIKEVDMPIVIDGHGNEIHIPREPEDKVIENAIPEIQYERYYRDIPKREASGKIVIVEIDGVKQIIFDHRKGDIVLDSSGNPRIIKPGEIPCPRWFTREDRERPSLRYDDRTAYHRSLDGIIDALGELSTEDLVKLDSVLDPLIEARQQRKVRQVIKSKYLPVCGVYGGGELQFELFDDDGNITEVLTHAEYKAKYGVDEA